jgi:hypothetical protein
MYVIVSVGGEEFFDECAAAGTFDSQNDMFL